MKTPRDKATELLSHYFHTVWQAAGLDWTFEHEGEIQDLADHLVDMVRDEIRMHREDAPHLYPDGSQS